jgi:hypothetical protein
MGHQWIFLYLSKTQPERSKMKANHFLLAASMALASSAYAGFYFDVGLGFGVGSTEIDGQDVSDMFLSSVDELAIDMAGVKIGYGPFGKAPIYVIGELSAMVHNFSKNSDYVDFTSFLLGPGIIYYPMPLMQLGASIGYSWLNNDSNLPMEFYKSNGGVAGNISVAIDLGKRKHGCLIGLKYFYATNRLKVSDVDQNSSMVSVFVKYAFRKKVSSLVDEEEAVSRKQAKKNNQQKTQSSFRTFAVKNFEKIVENDQNDGGEHLNSLILLMESEGIPKDEALLLIKRSIRKSNGDAEGFANELENSAE